jgi:LacI family transcriptional regulator
VTDRAKTERIDSHVVAPLRRRATMTDVAAKAGVSLKTVSRVVNRETGVTAELIDKVNSAVKELNYRHDVTASSLRRLGRKSLSIGLVLEDVANPFSSSLHRAVEDVAHSRGVVVFAGSSDENLDREKNLVEVFDGRHVDGMIMIATGSDQSYLRETDRPDTPIVFVDRPPQHFDADSVVTDNEAGSRRGVEHLIASGHRRIGFLGDLRSISTAKRRFDGYVSALQQANLAVDPPLVKRDLCSVDEAVIAMGQLLDLDSDTLPLTAIFAAQNLLTEGALRVLHARGLQHRVALLGFDEVLLSDLLRPGVSVLAQDPTQLGRRAAELLFARLDGDRSPTQHVVVPTTLISRGSGEIPVRDCQR